LIASANYRIDAARAREALYTRVVDRHRLAEERSIALHRAVADRLRADPGLLDLARARVREWRASKLVADYYVDVWERTLALPIERLCDALVDASESARAMRQASPFAGVLDARERWQIWRAVGAEARAR
jgi:hypothetical protein